MVNMADRPYDLVIFGASGYTGQCVIEYVVKTVEQEFKKHGDESQKLKWAVAGRNEDRLTKSLVTATLHISKFLPGFDYSKVPILICDVKDQSSVKRMVSQSKVVINCVGPYRFSGEQIVKACVENGTHHVDLSGEPQFLEEMQLKYNEEAEKKGIYIVGSCGFDSIPSDLGQMVVHRSMDGPVNTIETYLKTTCPPDEPGAMINFATYQCAIYGFAMAHELKSVRKALFPDRLPSLKPKLAPRGNVHSSKLTNSWCMPFPGSDRSVMMRSQRARYSKENKRPAQINCYVEISNLFWVMLTMIAGFMFGLLANYRFGRTLLEMFPGFFSFGTVSKKGPSRRMADNTHFEMKLFGKGWQGQDDGSLSNLGPETHEVLVTVKGQNMAYGATCECLVQSALTMIQEPELMPGSGGVFSPGFAFKDTTLVERLHENGVTFDVQVKKLKLAIK